MSFLSPFDSASQVGSLPAYSNRNRCDRCSRIGLSRTTVHPASGCPFPPIRDDPDGSQARAMAQQLRLSPLTPQTSLGLPPPITASRPSWLPAAGTAATAQAADRPSLLLVRQLHPDLVDEAAQLRVLAHYEQLYADHMRRREAEILGSLPPVSSAPGAPAALPASPAHPGAMVSPPPPRPALRPPTIIEGFELGAFEIRAANNTGTQLQALLTGGATASNSLLVSRANFDALLTSAGWSAGAVVDHFDINFQLPTNHPTLAYTVIVVMVAPGETAPANFAAASVSRLPRATRTQVSNQAHRFDLAGQDALASTYSFVAFLRLSGQTGTNPGTATAQPVLGFISVSVGAIAT